MTTKIKTLLDYTRDKTISLTRHVSMAMLRLMS